MLPGEVPGHKIDGSVASLYSGVATFHVYDMTIFLLAGSQEPEVVYARYLLRHFRQSPKARSLSWKFYQ